jgi:hypothetical protein
MFDVLMFRCLNLIDLTLKLEQDFAFLCAEKSRRCLVSPLVLERLTLTLTSRDTSKDSSEAELKKKSSFLF